MSRRDMEYIVQMICRNRGGICEGCPFASYGDCNAAFLTDSQLARVIERYTGGYNV